MDNLDRFRNEFLNANTWGQRKDGVPLDLLDNLSEEELKIAEIDLINAVSLGDSWPIIGLGYIKSTESLAKLYKLLSESKRKIKVTIAHSIFQICQDKEMINIVLEEMPKMNSQYELIDVLYFLPDFNDERVKAMSRGYCEDKNYLIAYNATRALGLPTEKVVEKFRTKILAK